MNTDKLIDEFVDAINTSQLLPLSFDEVPEYLRIGNQDEYGEFHWKISLNNCSKWVDKLKLKLPYELPKSYLSLITRYAFPILELKPAMLYANTGKDVFNELSKSIFKDKFMSEFLFKNGFVQLGVPYTGNYDPICFDCRKKVKNYEYPIVQLDHEMILCREKIKINKEIAPSFRSFIEASIKNLNVV